MTIQTEPQLVMPEPQMVVMEEEGFVLTSNERQSKIIPDENCEAIFPTLPDVKITEVKKDVLGKHYYIDTS